MAESATAAKFVTHALCLLLLLLLFLACGNLFFLIPLLHRAGCSGFKTNLVPFLLSPTKYIWPPTCHASLVSFAVPGWQRRRFGDDLSLLL